MFILTIKFGTQGLGFTMIENDDWGRVFVRLECPSYYDLNKTTEKAEEAIARIKDLPDLDYVLLSVGKADAMGGVSRLVDIQGLDIEVEPCSTILEGISTVCLRGKPGPCRSHTTQSEQ